MTDPGAAIADGTYALSPLSGGSGQNATATITAFNNTVVAWDPSPGGAGTGYEVGNSLTATLPGETTGVGAIATANPVFSGGTGFDISDGSVSNIATTTNGSGTGAEVSVNFSAGNAQLFFVQRFGLGYEVGDEIYVDAADVTGATTGDQMIITIDSVDEGTTGPDVTVSAEVATTN